MDAVEETSCENSHQDTITPGSTPTGWTSLPEELKLKILSCIFISADPVCFGNAQRFTISRKIPPYSIFFASHHLHRLATDIFYKQNTFNLARWHVTDTFWYPNPCINYLIRSLELRIGLSPRDWSFMHRLAAGILGFTNLQSVAVNVQTDSRYLLGGASSWRLRQYQSVFKDVVRNQAVTFQVDRLVVHYEQHLCQYDYAHSLSVLFDEIEKCVFEQLTAVPREDGRELVDSWEFRKRVIIRTSALRPVSQM